ncbi:hypothetical protein AX16_000098 [Volvariella volvacea WC 439]|nr:hypothetical protein AX16_000098 [Volvariella volvacea WC 439]
MVFSGEVHPFRLPVHDLWIDVFQKIKSLGFNAVSFYVYWGLLEHKRGEISFDGFRDLRPFLEAAKKVGLWLIARPGPYINAETSGGGFPGWGTYTPGLWRTSNASYVKAYEPYLLAVNKLIAEYQITNGGPVILVQSENEYSGFQEPYTEDFEYEKLLIDQFVSEGTSAKASDILTGHIFQRNSGIVVPITTNDAWPGGHYTMVDIYGYDSYPNGFDCSHPDVWQPDAVPEWFWDAHLAANPEDPNAVYEFQGGAYDGWGGSGYETCAQLTGPAFERVFYKNQFALCTTIFNLYMIFGGTNWGGIGHPGVYTSYDYGSVIAEDRTLRDKYYELKSIANFVAVSPAYLTSRPMNIYATQGAFTGNQALKTTLVHDVVGNKTSFYVVRQTDASSNAQQTYTLELPTSIGTLKIPTLGGLLTLNGKDSKIHVVDYKAGSTTLLYSTAEILTWSTVDKRDVIILYGDEGQLHETAITFSPLSGAIPSAKVVYGSGTIKTKVLEGGALAIQYKTTYQTVVEVGSTLLYLVDRPTAYQFWVLHTPSTGPFASFNTKNPVIVKGAYFMRSATITNRGLALTGDMDEATGFEIIAPAAVTRSITFNGESLDLIPSGYGTIVSKRNVNLPDIRLPNLSNLSWKTADSLPEIQPTYSDALWTLANKEKTDNPMQPLNTPTVLYAGEYGYHTGNILWRGHFNATGERGFKVSIIGGDGFAYSVWLDSTFIGSWEGDARHSSYEGIFNFPSTLRPGSSHVLTILQDHMGYELNWWAAGEFFKIPRGITGYSFIGGSNTTVSWKVTGNLGGEDYVDKTRGGLNEGGLYGERQGWHLPGFDDSRWKTGKPTDGISQAGVGFYRTTFDLNIPKGVDASLAFVTSNSTENPHFRAKFYVNGYQFGRYINHVGPQVSFPVPQGILNFNGPNTLAIALWAGNKGGAKLNSLELKALSVVESSINTIRNQPLTPWSPRRGAY